MLVLLDGMANTATFRSTAPVACLLDLSTLDYLSVYINKPRTIDELKRNIDDKISNFRNFRTQSR